MRLAEFITHDLDAILAQWEAFAATQLPAAKDLEALELRDHAQQILEAVAKDLSTSQSREAQLAKSLGQEPRLLSAPETAAQTHGLLRAKSGFDVNQLVAEYRALRASVLRRWMDACAPEIPYMDDIVRFNEAIDQAIAESIAFYSTQVNQTRDLFLAMLAHDLRTPLQAVRMTAEYLKLLDAGDKVSEAASRVSNSGAQMTALLNDLLDFNRSNLGLGIHIAPSEVDVSKLFADELNLVRAAHPGHQLVLELAGETRGVWDGPRLRQLLSNLVVNAIKYGTPGVAVRVTVTGDETELRFEVSNKGVAIDPATMKRLFEPLRRGATDEKGAHRDTSMGLGLFIAREIAVSHEGSIEARSDETQTVFTVRLPRSLQSAPSK